MPADRAVIAGTASPYVYVVGPELGLEQADNTPPKASALMASRKRESLANMGISFLLENEYCQATDKARQK
jgi:hypothetical protein